MRDLGDEELEEARDLVLVAADRRRQRRRVDVGRLERAHVELQPVAELLDAAEHAHRVALAEAAVEQLDVLPDARLDPPGRVDELEREVRRAGLRAQLALRAHGVDGLDDPVLRQLRDRHAASLPLRPDAEAGRIVVPVGDLLEDGGRLLAPPAERPAEVGRGQLARVAEHDRRELAACGLARREPLRQLPLARRAGRARARPTCCPARRGASSSARAGGGARRSAGRRPSSRAPVTSRSCGPGQRPELARSRSTTGSSVVRAARRSRRRASGRSRGATHAIDAREVLADADEPARRAARPSRPRRSPSPRPATNRHRRDRPVAGAPLTCSQSEGRTTSAFGKSSARPTLSTHLAACGTVLITAH